MAHLVKCSLTLRVGWSTPARWDDQEGSSRYVFLKTFSWEIWFDRSCWRKIPPMTLSRLDREWRSRFWTSILPKAELVLNLWSCFEQENWIHNFFRCKGCIYLLSFLNVFFRHSSPKHLCCLFSQSHSSPKKTWNCTRPTCQKIITIELELWCE